MKRIIRVVLFSFLVHMAGYGAFSQLRSPSEYNRDGIDLEYTYFVIYEGDEAGYGWASQWTQSTARTYADKVAFFKWHFKNGTVAYSRQGKHVGDIGMITKYLLTDESEKLVDVEGNAVQPMTLENYPVKVELWMGDSDQPNRFEPELLVDAACTDQESIQQGYAYYFSGCN
jgi:hypothetical protein